MGFMWNPAKTTTQYLYAGVLPSIPPNPVSDEVDVIVSVAVTPYGPEIQFYNPNGAI
jgi:hypothetical protein